MRVSSRKKSLQALARRWPRYLAEIIVVVFSILTAFALDNWREEQSRDREEVAILRAALTGLRADQSDIDFNMARHEEAVASLDVIVRSLERGAPYHDSLAAHFHNGTVIPHFIHSSSAFETLQSRGLDLISKEDVRDALVRV